jgi:hypothetical protein
VIFPDALFWKLYIQPSESVVALGNTTVADPEPLVKYWPKEEAAVSVIVPVAALPVTTPIKLLAKAFWLESRTSTELAPVVG